jgi:hypothetical protein
MIIANFFKRFRAGTALCKVPLYDNLSKLANIAETIQGAGGIEIQKPVTLNGRGWTIKYVGDQSSTQLSVARPWDIFFDANLIATCSNCIYKNLPVCVDLGILTLDCAAFDGPRYIGAKVNLETKSGELISAAEFTGVAVTDKADLDEYDYIPLYLVSFRADETPVIKTDYRGILVTGGYL